MSGKSTKTNNIGVRKARNGTGSVGRLPSGRYRWRISVGLQPDGTPVVISGTADTRADAENAKMMALADHLRGTLAQPDRVTVGAWLDRWLANKRPGWAAKTHHNNQQLVERHIKPHLGSMRLQAVRAVNLHDLYTTLTSKGLGDTQRQVHNVLHAAFDMAVRLDLIIRNPSDIVRPSPPRPDPTTAIDLKVLTAAEVTKLLAALKADRWGLIFEFMLATGLRRSEVCGLRWEDINLTTRQLRFRRGMVTVGGKAQISTPKTRSRARPLRLSEQAVDVLRRQADTQALERAALAPGRVKGHAKSYERQRPYENSGYVFTAVYGGQLHPDRLRRHLVRFYRAAGVKAVTNHGLRHTHASLMLRHGAPLEVVSKKLGHSRPSFTADVYRHVYDDELEQWALNLDELIDGDGKG